MNPWSSGSLLMAASADDAEGKHRRAAAPHQTGDLMPVEGVGIDLRQRLGDPRAPEPRRAPVVHERPVVVDLLRIACGIMASSLRLLSVFIGR